MKPEIECAWRTFCEKKYNPNDKCPECGGVLSDLVIDNRVQRKCTSFCGETYYQLFITCPGTQSRTPPPKVGAKGFALSSSGFF